MLMWSSSPARCNSNFQEMEIMASNGRTILNKPFTYTGLTLFFKDLAEIRQTEPLHGHA